jgi:hypothetical protein
LAASALRVRVTALNRVDLPTFGSPTIPALNMMVMCFHDVGCAIGVYLNRRPACDASIRASSLFCLVSGFLALMIQ